MSDDFEAGDIVAKSNPRFTYVVADPPRTARGKLRLKRTTSGKGILTTWWTPRSLPEDYTHKRRGMKTQPEPKKEPEPEEQWWHIFVRCVSTERFDVVAPSAKAAREKFESGDAEQCKDEVESREVIRVTKSKY